MSRAPDRPKERATVRLQSAYRAHRVRRWAWRTAEACHDERWERLGFLGRSTFMRARAPRGCTIRRTPPQ
eukprot:6715431-Alexandrium_andersonii.AAC.1